jgi:hypothetical protein
MNYNHAILFSTKSFIAKAFQQTVFLFQLVADLLNPQLFNHPQLKNIGISPLLVSTDPCLTLMHNRIKITRFNPKP